MPGTRTSDFLRSHPGAVAFAALFIGSFLVRLWPLVAVKQSWEDAYYYIELARSLSRGSYQLLGTFHNKYLPGYPALILFAHTALMGLVDWFKSAQLVSTLSSAALPGLCYVLAVDLTGDRRAGWAAGFMSALNAHLVTWSGIPFSEAPFACELMLTLCLIKRAPLLAGLVGGLAILTRHEGWFLAASLAVAPAISGLKPRQIMALAILLAVGAAWWILYHHELGQWPYEIYTMESSARAPGMGHPGLLFLLLALPTAGQLTCLFALPGIPLMAKKREAWPALAFLLPYLALHAWWMFGVERYFVPLVPLVCVMAGCGLEQMERLWKINLTPAAGADTASLLLRVRARKYAAPALGLLAGIIHFAGYAPAMIEEEAGRAAGYVKAVKYVAEKPGHFSVLAYDAFLVGYYDPHHPVIPSALLKGSNWGNAIADLYVEQGLRYIIWSDLYPEDREKFELSQAEITFFPGKVMIAGKERELEIDAVPEKVFYFMHKYPRPSRFRPWREELADEVKVIVFRLEPGPQ
jgi:4-amino-4-deoxy-L-arabinose transferase-like glycosyltransferase